MTKKDFELIAQAFAEAEAILDAGPSSTTASEAALAALKIAAMRMSAHLGVWTHFDQQRFLDACFPITKVGNVNVAIERWSS